MVTSISNAVDCVAPEEHSAHYLGLQALSENYPDPILVWWNKEWNDREEFDEENMRTESLSKKNIFNVSRKILEKEKAEMYLLAWLDTLNISGKDIKVAKISFAYSKLAPAFDVAYEVEKDAIVKSIRLGQEEATGTGTSRGGTSRGRFNHNALTGYLKYDFAFID